MISSKASWVFIVNGSSSPLLSLSLFSSTEPRGPPDRHGPAHSSVSFIATVIIIAVFIYRAARDIRSQWSRPKPRGPSLPLFLSCTEPSRSPDRHGPVHSSFNLHRPVDLHRHCYRYRCCHLQSCVGHQIVTLPPKAQLASLPLLLLSLLSLLSCTERPPDRHGVIQSSVDLHRHCYRYRCCHLQSCVGHQIATIPPIVQLTFIATIIVIVVVIYRAATRSRWSRPKPRGPSSPMGLHRHFYLYRCCHLQSCVGHQIVTLPPKAQLASSPLLLLSLLSCTERPPDRPGVIQSSVGLHRHRYRYRYCHLQSLVGHLIATVPSAAQLASSPPLSLSLFSSTEPHGTSDRSGLVQSPEGLHCRCSTHNTTQLVSSPPLSLSLFSSTEPCGAPDRHGAVQSPVGLHRHRQHQHGGRDALRHRGGPDDDVEGRAVPRVLLHRHPYPHPELRHSAVAGNSFGVRLHGLTLSVSVKTRSEGTSSWA